MVTAVSVLGAGSWGTALAILLARGGTRVMLWARDSAQAASIEREGQNSRYLPGVELPGALRVTSGLDEALEAPDLVLVAVPSHAFAEVIASLAARVSRPARVVWATKGLHPVTGRLLYEVARQHLSHDSRLAILSGPTFAGEVAAGLPAAATVASTDAAHGAELVALFAGPRFRVYTSTDVVGVQVGGAIKNVLAIAAGIADGLGFGANARAALITRGLAELTRLGLALGARRETLMGLSGLGDLVLTCTDDQSRNRRFGLALARGEDPGRAERSIGQVVEGVRTAHQAAELARELSVDMPIVAEVDRVLNAGVTPAEAVDALFARRPRSEVEDGS